MTRTAIYRFYDTENRLLYVGIADDPEKRYSQHRAQAVWFSRVGHFSFQWCESRAHAVALESVAIRFEKPLHNAIGALREGKPAHDGLLNEIEAHCAETGLTKSAFGKGAVKDPRFVFDLEEGREVRSKTVRRVRDFMASVSSATAAPTSEAAS